VNWKYGIGLTLTILGAILSGLVWFIIFGAPLYVIGVVLIARSGKGQKTKLLAIFLPWIIPLIPWCIVWFGYLK
jgi:hypothetical protein